MTNINPVGPIQEGGAARRSQGIRPQQKNGASFKDTLKTFLNDVNSMQIKADKSIEKMISGEITDVHQVMSSAEEAKTAFNMMMEIRNKVMDAYQEVMRIRL
ncbi:MAG TPA: flagellar hook-basal body complex protein FliE [Chitinispirillaceae bacterium]|nr:flagellar hook-basal body complex protein FliE [Chitinispirillaceae bacterium]